MKRERAVNRRFFLFVYKKPIFPSMSYFDSCNGASTVSFSCFFADISVSHHRKPLNPDNRKVKVPPSTSNTEILTNPFRVLSQNTGYANKHAQKKKKKSGDKLP